VARDADGRRGVAPRPRGASIDDGIAQRLGSAAGFRNLIAHRYGVIDWKQVFERLDPGLDDLETIAATLPAHLSDFDAAR
jgi:uncharacterized protein YutE (UPF0331/DUF86 family)